MAHHARRSVQHFGQQWPQLLLLGVVSIIAMRRVHAISVLRGVVRSAALLCVLVGACTAGAASATAFSLPGVACPSVAQCTAVDSAGREVTFNPSAVGAPIPTTIDTSSDLQAIACPSVTQCTAVDQGGREVTFNPAAPGNPTPVTIDGGPGRVWAVACPSVAQCTAVDTSGGEVTFDPTAVGRSTPTVIDGAGVLTAVACPSVSQCTAIDPAGRELTFDPTAPGSPTSAVVDQPHFCGPQCPEAFLTAVACPSVAQCTAVDGAGQEVTFDPRAPGNPTPIYISQNVVFFGGFNAVACPSVASCTAVDRFGREVTFKPNAPGSPTPTTVDSVSLRAVACPSSTQCTAVDESGGEVTFDPAAPGSATWAMIDGGGLAPPPVTTTTTGSVRPGLAQAAGSARVKRGFAAIKLTCSGAGACKGTIKLLARVAAKRAVHYHGMRHVVERTRTVVLGTAAFSIARGASIVVRVHLSRQGMTLMLRARRHGLRVKIGGSGIKTSSLVLVRLPA
jgi:hypothetical protein